MKTNTNNSILNLQAATLSLLSFPWFLPLLWAAVWLAPVPVSAVGPAVVYVDDDYTDGNCGGHEWGVDAFATIQAGINALAEGGTVNVAAGTYTENVTVNKQLTLDGAGSGSGVGDTILQSAAANTPVMTITGSGGGLVVVWLCGTCG